MVIVVLFLAGLIWASTLGAVIWRINNEKGFKGFLGGRSKCEQCSHTLKVVDLIPVLGWLIQKGRCRHCQNKVDWHYPMSELLTGGLFVLSWAFWPVELESAETILKFSLWLMMLSVLIVIALRDIRTMEIENYLIYPLIVMAIIWRFVEAIIFSGGAHSMRELSLGLLAGSGLFIVLFYASKEKWIGGGDVKLGIFLGAWLGVSQAILALTIGFYAAFVVVVPLIIIKRVHKRQPVPFGPFLIIGIITATIYGSKILEWYQNIST